MNIKAFSELAADYTITYLLDYARFNGSDRFEHHLHMMSKDVDYVIEANANVNELYLIETKNRKLIAIDYLKLRNKNPFFGIIERELASRRY